MPQGSFESVEKAMEFASSLPAWQDALSKVDFADDSDHDDDDASSQGPQVEPCPLSSWRCFVPFLFKNKTTVCSPTSSFSLPLHFCHCLLSSGYEEGVAAAVAPPSAGVCTLVFGVTSPKRCESHLQLFDSGGGGWVFAQ